VPTFQTERERLTAIAWFLAGEGTVTITSVTRHTGRINMRPRVRAVSSDLVLLKQFADLVGQGNITVTHKNRPKPLHQWELCGIPKIVPFLLKIQPFMPYKQEQIVCVLEFCELRKKKIALAKSGKAPFGEEEFKILERLRTVNLKPHQASNKWKFLDRWYNGHKNVEVNDGTHQNPVIEH
jgi:hypothetical protein